MRFYSATTCVFRSSTAYLKHFPPARCNSRHFLLQSGNCEQKPIGYTPILSSAGSEKIVLQRKKLVKYSKTKIIFKTYISYGHIQCNITMYIVKIKRYIICSTIPIRFFQKKNYTYTFKQRNSIILKK